MLDADTCYRALTSRDARFDGRFFTAVTSTGVFCRPVCPARTPKRGNVRFFASAAAATGAGFRPCRRCRPETAPGSAPWAGGADVVRRALRLIEAGALDDGGTVGDLAARLGVTARHLGRLFDGHVGAPPGAVARTRRAHLARRLLDETDLPVTAVAFAAGYGSVRQFNSALRDMFGAPPGALRRARAPRNGALTIRLAYRPPLSWTALLAHLAPRATPGVEDVHGDVYRRVITVDDEPGVLELTDDPAHSQLLARLEVARTRALGPVIARARRLADLDADPSTVAAHLRADPELSRRLDAGGSLRIPGGWEPFELAVRTVLGQQVSVAAATTLAGRVAARFGSPVETGRARLSRQFPTAAQLRAAPLEEIGVVGARARTIRGLAAAVADGELHLDGVDDLGTLTARLRALPGIGPWTASYVALRGCGEPDAFPAGDLGLRKALAADGAPIPADDLAVRAQRWRPWRGYAAMLLWTTPRDTTDATTAEATTADATTPDAAADRATPGHTDARTSARPGALR